MCIERPYSVSRSLRQAQWIVDIANGKRDAFELLHRDTSSNLMTVISRLESNVSQAEEIHQDCYIKIWQSAKSYDPGRGQPSTWLNAIARNAGRDHLRRAGTRPQIATRLARESDDETDPFELIPGDGPGPFDVLSSASDRSALCACMDRLSSKQRQTLAFAYFHDLTHAEVATRLRQPLGTVKSWIRRSLISLRKCMEQTSGA